MKIVIDGVVHADPRTLRIEVDPAGETILGPLTIEIAGGRLYVEPGEPVEAGWIVRDADGVVQEIATPTCLVIRTANPGAGIYLGDSLAVHDDRPGTGG
jgi:hypothetical protein